MARKRSRRLTKAEKENPVVKSICARNLHGRALPGAIYAEMIRPLAGDDKDADAALFARDAIRDMKPRDPAEEMLIAQMLLAHARATRLSQLSLRQTNSDALRIMNEYADRASNTYRRLMLALAEYRRPPRSGDTFAVVKQTNIAGQQVIQNHEKSNENATNEQGSSQPRPEARHQLPAVPADTGRFDVPSFHSQAREAVEEVHRPAHGQRQGQVPNERDEAR